MNGTSHFIVGCGVSLTLAYVGIKHDDLLLVASAVSAPLGAMLPDIDHNNSKIGRQRKQMVDTIQKVIFLSGFGVFMFTSLMNAISGGDYSVKGIFLNGILPSLITYGPLLASILLATSEGVKKRIKFFTKHRGIMHTLLPVLGLYIGSINSSNTFISAILLGLGFGYTSHLFADMETKAGCPVLWPISDESIHVPFIRVTTGTGAEKLVLLMNLGGLACLAYIL